MQRQILAYLRGKVSPLPPSSERGKEAPPHIPESPPRNVRGASSDPAPTPKAQNVRGSPAPRLDDVLLVAIGRVKAHLPDHLHPLTRGLYDEWKASLFLGQKVLTARGGRRFLHDRIRQTMGEEITASAIDSLLSLFRAYLFKEGYLIPNPKYTGKPPFPRFILRIKGGGL